MFMDFFLVYGMLLYNIMPGELEIKELVNGCV